jgi:hypothetical protein
MEAEAMTITDAPLKVNGTVTVAEPVPRAVAPAEASVFSAIERIMTDPNASVERANQAFEFYQKVQADQARKAFDAAMADAKAEMPAILKNRVVDFTSQKGRTNYKHEDLGEIARTIDPVLGRHGLSYRFRTTSAPNEPILVTCIVSHRLGYSEENSLQAGRDESGNKNSIQAIGSTITYLQRYTLKAALGLAASNDDDAKAADQTATDVVTDAQATELRDLITKTGTDLNKFLEVAKAECVPDVLAKDFPRLKQLLTTKLKGAKS